MKKISISQMEKIEGGSFDCSADGQLAFISGGAAAGALAGPFGFLGGLAGTLAYSVYKCYKF